MSTKKKTTRRPAGLRSIASRLEGAAKMLTGAARDLKAHAAKGVKASTASKTKKKRKAAPVSGVKRRKTTTRRKGVRVAYKRAA